MNALPFYIDYLKHDLARRQRTNNSYSLRAYAKFLGIYPQTLSAILAAKRPLPGKSAEAILDKLNLSPKLKSEFLESVYHQKASVREFQKAIKPSPVRIHLLLEKEEQFSVIADWEHFAIFELVDTQRFKPDTPWIAKRLGISQARAKTALERLLKLGLLVANSKGQITRSIDALKTTDDVLSPALQRAHLESLELGASKLKEVPIDFRDFSSVTIPTNPQKLTEAKKLIRKFRSQMSALLEDGPREEVFQLCIQLYPLTQINESKKDLLKEGTK